MLIDPTKYLHYELLEELLDVFKVTANKIDWDNIIDNLTTSTKESSDDTTWFTVCTDNGIQTYNTNSGIETEKINDSLNGSKWLYLGLLDDSWKTYPHALANSLFFKEINLINKIPGARLAAVNYISKNAIVQPHTDGLESPLDDSYFYTILLTEKINSSGTLLLVNKDKHELTPNSIFGFDAHYTHGVENFSKGDWVFITIRIKKNYLGYIRRTHCWPSRQRSCTHGR
jgi:hypothetical protein